MQIIQNYLVENEIRLQLAGSVLLNTEDRQVYAKPIKLYKGVDNTLKLRFRNQDQKAVAIATFDPPEATVANPDYTVLVKLFRAGSQEQVLSKPATLDLTTYGVGIASITLTATDLADLIPKFYEVAVVLIDESTNMIAAYNDDNYGVRLGVEVFEGPIAAPVTAQSLDQVALSGPPTGMTVTNPVTISELHTNSSTFTFQLYFDSLGYTGTVDVQGATIMSSPTENDWTTLASVDYVAQITPTYMVVTGTYTYLRAKFTTTTGTVSEVLFAY
jgi:hypothetical protein